MKRNQILAMRFGFDFFKWSIMGSVERNRPKHRTNGNGKFCSKKNFTDRRIRDYFGCISGKAKQKALSNKK